MKQVNTLSNNELAKILCKHFDTTEKEVYNFLTISGAIVVVFENPTSDEWDSKYYYLRLQFVDELGYLLSCKRRIFDEFKLITANELDGIIEKYKYKKVSLDNNQNDFVLSRIDA